MKEKEVAIDIGVVIPWGKLKGNIHRCIESALNQTFQPSHILVVANGKITQPEQSRLTDRYASQKVTVLYLPGCSNANIARNLGSLYLPCTHIAFLDSDDWWDESHLEQSTKALIDSGADLIYSGMRVHRDDNVIQYHHAEDYRNYSSMESYLLNYLPAQTSTYFCKKAALPECLWDFSLKRHQDYEFIARFSKNHIVRHATFVATNVDWGSKRRHKLHSDCFKVLASWKGKVPFGLYKRHFKNLFISSILSNDMVWLRKVPQLLVILVNKDTSS